MTLSTRLALLALACIVTQSLPAQSASRERPVVTVFAAASLTDALKEASDAYTKSSGVPIRLSFAASSAMARQIEAGAKADVFFSADLDWVDYLQSRGLIDAKSRHNVLSNGLVMIAPLDSKIQLHIQPNFPLADILGKARLATGDPDSVPVGRYARAALMSLGVWNRIADRIVRADNVRTALAYVARGEAKLGIVYATDARIEPKVRIVDTFPENTHSPILYPIALTRTASPQAKQYLDFIAGPVAAAIFQRYGFTAQRPR